MEKFVYIHGDTIHFYYVVENVGTDTVSFDAFIHDPNHAFVIYPDSCSALDQPGCYDAAIYFYPETTYLPPQAFTLLPGECEIFTMTWDQVIPLQGTYPDPGHYNAFAGLWQANPDWPGTFLYNSELSLDIVIETEPISVETSTWGRIKSLYWAESLSD
ncbi:MAG: hypothetical protein GTO51_08855 [Candidatus Latescibacteria bacterium]|nr:hypothetical protein [Candidatus Latescibacterota bacterium]NIM66079.1 hypothetical protein [Candidatus Latescibacterota bacterium]NIO02487.1 hypothetical protein [Candidatus Latescibacterota bacterium]NIT02972.1 hypothetical protein [Candidatus Latescibacterota bacterium]NIT39400.1 hypothetical protein [Candidatus Latescibacterota bacterium]